MKAYCINITDIGARGTQVDYTFFSSKKKASARLASVAQKICSSDLVQYSKGEYLYIYYKDTARLVAYRIYPTELG